MSEKNRRAVFNRKVIRFILVLFCFLFGMILGQIFAGKTSESMFLEIRQYLIRVLQIEFKSRLTLESTLSLLWSYFRYPLLLILLGSSTIGAFLLPVALIVFSFFMSFSVCCFYAALGVDGLLFAAVTIGLRCFATIICLFIISLNLLNDSTWFACDAFGRGHRAALPQFGRIVSLKYIGMIFLVLFFCVCFDLFCSPWILSKVL